MEADQKAAAEAAARQWEAQAKRFAPENMPVPTGAGGASGAGGSGGVGAGASMFAMPMAQEPGFTPAPTTGGGLSSAGAGRTPEEKAAAVAAVDAELARQPALLPRKEDAPSQSDILKLAADRNGSARKLFRPEELSAYSRAVDWTLRFDGQSPDAQKAKNYSLSVASVTNYFNMPHFMIAFAAAVFSLDPETTAGANNLAAAILTAGERLYPEENQAKALVPFRKDAESCYLYALAASMKDDAWTDQSLTALINLGHLYVDMDKLDEARALFQAARAQSPFSWDAALGMAAYFHAVGRPDKAQAILDDENLDRPSTLMVAKKASKALEKSEEVPIDAPEELFEKNIRIVAEAPIATSADFMAQIDQSERNRMRYFVEHLPVQGSFKAPPIKKLTQYASLKAINSPQGQSALKDFSEMLQIYSISSFAGQGKEQLKMLERLGMKVDPGVDLDDVAKHPEKYKDGKRRSKVKVDKSELMANLEQWKKQAQVAKNELALGKTTTLTAMAADIDPFFAILQIDPQDYADPMNIIIQKHNFAVHNRKSNLYRGYLRTANKQVHQALREITGRYGEKIAVAAELQEEDLKSLDAQCGGSTECLLRKHAVHVAYFNACNGAATTAFGSAANVATVAYMQKIQPNAEAYYYDVFRHVALISDPEVRRQKDSEMRQAIYAELVYALNNVGAAHGSFKHHDEWDCGCNLQALLQKREAEEEARRDEENARILRNKAAKLAFDSGEIPESTPLFKKIDGYGFDFDYFFFKGRMSPARTVVHFNLKLPVPGSPELFASQSISEFTGAATYGQGIKVTLGAEQGGAKAGAYFNLSSSVTTDGQGVVKDYSVTAGTGLTVSGKGGTSLSVGGEMTFGPNGVKDSDFSAGVSRDFKNDYGGAGNVAFEASTKHGCKLSGAVEQTLEGPGDFINEAKEKAVGKDLADQIPTDDLFKQKREWPGTFSKEK
jgi:tetratricopeptide (TPR) repeat protein